MVAVAGTIHISFEMAVGMYVEAQKPPVKHCLLMKINPQQQLPHYAACLLYSTAVSKWRMKLLHGFCQLLCRYHEAEVYLKLALDMLVFSPPGYENSHRDMMANALGTLRAKMQSGGMGL